MTREQIDKMLTDLYKQKEDVCDPFLPVKIACGDAELYFDGGIGSDYDVDPMYYDIKQKLLLFIDSNIKRLEKIKFGLED